VVTLLHCNSCNSVVWSKWCSLEQLSSITVSSTTCTAAYLGWRELNRTPPFYRSLAREKLLVQLAVRRPPTFLRAKVTRPSILPSSAGKNTRPMACLGPRRTYSKPMQSLSSLSLSTFQISGAELGQQTLRVREYEVSETFNDLVAVGVCKVTAT
jgi:hypothetical protein